MFPLGKSKYFPQNAFDMTIPEWSSSSSWRRWFGQPSSSQMSQHQTENVYLPGMHVGNWSKTTATAFKVSKRQFPTRPLSLSFYTALGVCWLWLEGLCTAPWTPCCISCSTWPNRLKSCLMLANLQSIKSMLNDWKSLNAVLLGRVLTILLQDLYWEKSVTHIFNIKKFSGY